MTSAIIASSQQHKHRIQLYYVTCRGCGLAFVRRSECHLPLGHYCESCVATDNPHMDHPYGRNPNNLWHCPRCAQGGDPRFHECWR